MTVAISSGQLAARIGEKFPGSVIVSGHALEVKPEFLVPVATYLKDTPDLAFNYLTAITGIDYEDYFELVYQLTSIEHNHSLILKTRIYDRGEPVAPSVISLWRGADFQEREIHDLLGIRFEGHPNMKPIVLWEGFKGHPLRKDYLEW